METETPKKLGYRMPAEWEKHEATWLTFPHNENTWPNRLSHVQELFGEMIAHVSQGEKVNLLVQNTAIKKRAQQMIGFHSFAHPENIRFHPIKTMDSWIRDYGPTFVVNKEQIAFVHWTFNGWGMKYEAEEPLSNDKIIPDFINQKLHLLSFKPGIVLEGGSIEVNGQGTVITSEQCLLNSNRNPQLNRHQIEEYLREYLHVEKVVWVHEGIEGDDTDGHIDDMVRFVNSHQVLCVMPNPDDSNYPAMCRNYEILKASGLEVKQLPMPLPIYFDHKKRRLPASYANFYIANAVVIVPIFNDPNDALALDIITQCFPDRRTIPLESTDIVYGFGAWHCLSQQQPIVKTYLNS